MTKAALILLPLLALSACATPETRVRSALMDAGLGQSMASCMAQRMVDKLSLLQLKRLSSLSGLRDTRIGDMTFKEFLYKTRALNDPQIFTVISKAGIGCAIAT